MSTFLWGTGNSVLFQAIGWQPVNDDRLQPPEYKLLGNDFNANVPMDHADILWPRSHLQGAASLQGGGLFLSPDPAAQMWEWNVYVTGSRHRMVFTGVTLNASG